MTRYLCKLSGVSPSGYYRWIGAEETRQIREDIDERDFSLLKAHYDALQGKAGALVIKMRLDRLSGVVMNHKKIRRLMRKYKLVAKIRQKSPYRKMAKATQETSNLPKPFGTPVRSRRAREGLAHRHHLYALWQWTVGLSVLCEGRCDETDPSSLSLLVLGVNARGADDRQVAGAAERQCSP